MLMTARATAALMAATLLAACNSGPSESEFLAACQQEGQRGANRAMSKALGVERDAYCKCAAGAAKSTLSPEGYSLMVYEMQGKRQEVAALQAKMNNSEKMTVMQAALEVLGKCAGPMR